MNKAISINPKIGIFWLYQNTVLGQAIDLSAGEEGVPGLLDSPATHVHLWERIRNQSTTFPELRHEEYDQIPRGRVLWLTHKDQAIVYMDTKLFNLEDMALITSFFSLGEVSVSWQRDAHYTTQQRSFLPDFDDEF
jgi:hypothetical protein